MCNLWFMRIHVNVNVIVIVIVIVIQRPSHVTEWGSNKGTEFLLQTQII